MSFHFQRLLVSNIWLHTMSPISLYPLACLCLSKPHGNTHWSPSMVSNQKTWKGLEANWTRCHLGNMGITFTHDGFPSRVAAWSRVSSGQKQHHIIISDCVQPAPKRPSDFIKAVYKTESSPGSCSYWTVSCKSGTSIMKTTARQQVNCSKTSLALFCYGFYCN